MNDVELLEELLKRVSEMSVTQLLELIKQVDRKRELLSKSEVVA